MKDSYNYRDGSRWYYKRGWFNPRVTNKTSRCWKDQSKRRSQHRRTPHFDLYKPFEQDECGFIVTDAEIEQLCHLVETYPRLFAI